MFSAFLRDVYVAAAGIWKLAAGRVFAADTLGLTDGVTAPSAVAGYALIYVDTSGGDLKVVFGDGTVKTIVTDT
jgi:hypothetical protein